MEVENGNKMIAEFMEHDTEEIYHLFGPRPYDLEWNHLMPVVEKIESKGVKIEIDGIGCDINRLNPFHPYNNGAACDTKIESVWLAIVQFIQWYNSKSPSKNINNQHGKE